MSDIKFELGSGGHSVLAVRGLLIGIVVGGLFAPGCHKEHRITLDQFLAVEEASKLSEVAKLETLPAPVADRRLGPYQVGTGDVMRVTLTGSQGNSIPVQVRVDRDGAIELPVVGPVSVGGKELEDVEDVIRAAYVPRVYADTVVHVEMVLPETVNVLVIGSVSAPGFVQLRRTERNMLYAIVGAGGVSVEASGRATLRRIRRPTETATYDLTDPAEVNNALALAPLETGDIITVEAATPNTVFVGGLVNRPAPQIYAPGTHVTALQALAGASGLRTDVWPSEGTLIRRMPDGKDVQVKLDLGRIARGEDANITLAAGDILWVPETVGTRIQDWVNKNIFMRGGISATYTVTGIEYMNRQSQQSSGMSGSSNLENSFDPLGFLGRNALLQNINTRPP